MLYKLLLAYFLLVNAAAFILMMADKIKARKNRWRIKESTLMLSAALGGSIGALAGMYTFRHKTLHRKFIIGACLCQLFPKFWGKVGDSTES